MKTVLITGATSGFGEATARKFAADGCKLILTGRRSERLEKLQQELSVPTHIAAFDIQDQSQCKDFVKNIPAEFQPVDILVNSAGLALGTAPADEGLLEDWLTMVNTNVIGLITITRLILPIMVKNGSGYIFNIASTAGNYAYPGGNVYCATKSFVKQFSACLRADLISKNIRVTNIEPGMAETEFSIVRLGDTSKADSVYAGMQALKAEDIAETIHWCASRPPHVNVSRLEVMPTVQANGALAVHRESK